MNLIGDKIELKSWQEYNGGLSVTGHDGKHSYFTKLNEISIMFHVGLLIPQKYFFSCSHVLTTAILGIAILPVKGISEMMLLSLYSENQTRNSILLNSSLILIVRIFAPGKILIFQIDIFIIVEKRKLEPLSMPLVKRHSSKKGSRKMSSSSKSQSSNLSLPKEAMTPQIGYHVQVVCKSVVQPFSPYIRKDLLSPSELREFLLTKGLFSFLSSFQEDFRFMFTVSFLLFVGKIY